MKWYFLCLFIAINLVVHSQKTPLFLTTFYFEDAIGNRDSLEIGFDTAAKNAYNPDYGEMLNQTPFKNDFDVRAVHLFEYYGPFPSKPPNLISKRIVGGAEKIVNAKCISGEFLIFFINSVHQPITISVKSVIDFEKLNCPGDNSREFFSPDQLYHYIEPWIWAKLNGVRYGCVKDSSYTFYLGKGVGEKFERPYILNYEIEGKGVDTIYGVCFAMDQTFYFCDKSYVKTEDYQNEFDDLIIYPNPIENYFHIQNNLISNPESVSIYDQIGRFINSSTWKEYEEKRIVDTNNLPKGMYFITFKFRNGISKIKKFIKM